MATVKKAQARDVKRRPKAESRDDAPRYQVLETSYIDNRLLQPGSEVVYWGIPGRALKPLNDAAKANKKVTKEIRNDPGYEGETPEEAAARVAQELREVDNDMQGVVAPDEDEEEYADTDIRVNNPRNTKPLPDAERAELEKHAQASIEATKEAEIDDTNRTTIKLQGNLVETPVTLQGSTPVLDKGGKK